MQSGPHCNNGTIMMIHPCCLQLGAYCLKRIVVPFIQAQILSNLYNIGRNWARLNKDWHHVSRKQPKQKKLLTTYLLQKFTFSFTDEWWWPLLIIKIHLTPISYSSMKKIHSKFKYIQPKVEYELESDTYECTYVLHQRYLEFYSKRPRLVTLIF